MSLNLRWISPRGRPEVRLPLPILDTEDSWRDSGEHQPLDLYSYLKSGMIGADFGCGTGLVSWYALNITRSPVYPFDLNLKSLKLAKTEFQDYSIVRGNKFVWINTDLRNGIPLIRGSLDYAICMTLIENLGKDRENFISDIPRVLKPNSWFFLTWTLISEHYRERYQRDFPFTSEKDTIVIWKEDATIGTKETFYQYLTRGDLSKAEEIYRKFGDRLVHHLSGLDELQQYFPPSLFSVWEYKEIPGYTHRKKRPIQVCNAILKRI